MVPASVSTRNEKGRVKLGKRAARVADTMDNPVQDRGIAASQKKSKLVKAACDHDAPKSNHKVKTSVVLRRV